jgi:hypothetical protein
MNIFEYITFHNPNEAAQLCANYGMRCNEPDEITNGLFTIAEMHGDNGFRNVVALHPDKEAITQYFSGREDCDKCRRLNQGYIITNQADGGTSTAQAPAVHKDISAVLETNKLLVIGIVCSIGLALIITNIKK